MIITLAVVVNGTAPSKIPLLICSRAAWIERHSRPHVVCVNGFFEYLLLDDIFFGKQDYSKLTVAFCYTPHRYSPS